MEMQRDLFATPWLPDNFSRSVLADEEGRVYDALLSHQGAANAIEVEHLATVLDSSERAVRSTAKHLTERYGIAIASSTQKPYGLYLITDPDELEAYIKNLTSRGLSNLKRAASLKRTSLPRFIGQLQLTENA